MIDDHAAFHGGRDTSEHQRAQHARHFGSKPGVYARETVRRRLGVGVDVESRIAQPGVAQSAPSIAGDAAVAATSTEQARAAR